MMIKRLEHHPHIHYPLVCKPVVLEDTSMTKKVPMEGFIEIVSTISPGLVASERLMKMGFG
jgi:hypothetical protein